MKQQKIDHKQYVDKQDYQARQLKEEFSALKEQLVKDDLLKWIVKNKKTFNTQVENILSGKANPRDLPLSEKMQEYLSQRQQYAKIQPLVEEFKTNHETSETLKLLREGLIAGRELKREDREYIDGIKIKMGVDLNSPSDADAIGALIDGVEVKQNAIRQQAGSRDPAAQLVELEGAYAEARVAALKEHQGLFADLGRMQDIQNELMERKSKLKELHEAIKNVADMPRDEAQWKMGLIEEALGKIDEQIKENAKVLNVESHLGKLFDQEIVVPTPVQQTVVTSAPDLVGEDQQA